MKKILICALLALSINIYASVNGTAQDPNGSMYQRQTRAITNHYEYSLNNTTNLIQTYFLHAELCPTGWKCKIIDREITLHPGQSMSDNFDIQMDVYYLHPGTMPLYAILNIRGESNLDIRRNGFIYVNA